MKAPAVPTKVQAGAAGKGSAIVGKFTGTDNPRHLRAIEALMRGPVDRKALDRIIGCTNSPAVVAALRTRGLEVPCKLVRCLDRDGRHCDPGVYELSKRDKALVHRWKGGIHG